MTIYTGLQTSTAWTSSEVKKYLNQSYTWVALFVYQSASQIQIW